MRKRFLGKAAVMLCAAILVVSCNKGKAPGQSGEPVPSIDSLTLGKDYTDLKAAVQFKTHRTDIIDSVLKRYVTDFQKMYPGIKITYEGITDYAAGMTTRLSTPTWGDICMIPVTVPLTELSNYFQPLGALDVLEQVYNFADKA